MSNYPSFTHSRRDLLCEVDPQVTEATRFQFEQRWSQLTTVQVVTVSKIVLRGLRLNNSTVSKNRSRK